MPRLKANGSMLDNTLTIYATITGLVLNGAGLVFVATQVVLARQQLRHNLAQSVEEAKRIKRQATIEFYMATMAKVNEWRSILPGDWDRPRIDAFTREVYGRKGAGKMLILATYLAYFEALAVAVRGNVYDLAVLDAIAGSRILNICQNYQVFFERRRKEVGSDLAYHNLEWLGREIQRVRTSPGYTHAP